MKKAAFQEGHGGNDLIVFKIQPEGPKAEIPVSYRIYRTVSHSVNASEDAIWTSSYPSYQSGCLILIIPFPSHCIRVDETKVEWEFRSGSLLIVAHDPAYGRMVRVEHQPAS